MKKNNSNLQKMTPENSTAVSKLGPGSSYSKVVVFTPEQLKVLDLDKQLQDLLCKQANSNPTPENKRSHYKKRHPMLVKDKSKLKAIDKEKIAKNIITSTEEKTCKISNSVENPNHSKSRIDVKSKKVLPNITKFSTFAGSSKKNTINIQSSVKVNVVKSLFAAKGDNSLSGSCGDVKELPTFKQFNVEEEMDRSSTERSPEVADQSITKVFSQTQVKEVAFNNLCLEKNQQIKDTEDLSQQFQTNKSEYSVKDVNNIVFEVEESVFEEKRINTENKNQLNERIDEEESNNEDPGEFISKNSCFHLTDVKESKEPKEILHSTNPQEESIVDVKQLETTKASTIEKQKDEKSKNIETDTLKTLNIKTNTFRRKTKPTPNLIANGKDLKQLSDEKVDQVINEKEGINKIKDFQQFNVTNASNVKIQEDTVNNSNVEIVDQLKKTTQKTSMIIHATDEAAILEDNRIEKPVKKINDDNQAIASPEITNAESLVTESETMSEIKTDCTTEDILKQKEGTKSLINEVNKNKNQEKRYDDILEVDMSKLLNRNCSSGGIAKAITPDKGEICTQRKNEEISLTAVEEIECKNFFEFETPSKKRQSGKISKKESLLKSKKGIQGNQENDLSFPVVKRKENRRSSEKVSEAINLENNKSKNEKTYFTTPRRIEGEEPSRKYSEKMSETKTTSKSNNDKFSKSIEKISITSELERKLSGKEEDKQSAVLKFTSSSRRTLTEAKHEETKEIVKQNISSATLNMMKQREVCKKSPQVLQSEKSLQKRQCLRRTETKDINKSIDDIKTIKSCDTQENLSFLKRMIKTKEVEKSHASEAALKVSPSKKKIGAAAVLLKGSEATVELESEKIIIKITEEHPEIVNQLDIEQNNVPLQTSTPKPQSKREIGRTSKLKSKVFKKEKVTVTKKKDTSLMIDSEDLQENTIYGDLISRSVTPEPSRDLEDSLLIEKTRESVDAGEANSMHLTDIETSRVNESQCENIQKLDLSIDTPKRKEIKMKDSSLEPELNLSAISSLTTVANVSEIETQKKRGKARKCETLPKTNQVEESTPEIATKRSCRNRKLINYSKLAKIGDNFQGEDSEEEKELQSNIKSPDLSIEKPKQNLKVVDSEASSCLVEETLNSCATEKVEVKIPKKRGRKKKSEILSKTPDVLKASTSEIIVGRSGRKRKLVDYSKLSYTYDCEQDSEEEIAPKNLKRCKKEDDDVFEIDVDITTNKEENEINCSITQIKEHKKIKGVSTTHSRLYSSLVSDAKLFDTSINENQGEEPAIKSTSETGKKGKKLAGTTVTCDVCKLIMEKRSWNSHKLKRHNNLAWRVGDKPLDLNNEKVVLGILNLMYRNGKSFLCDKCEASVRSVQGYLSHRSRCQRSSEELIAVHVTCEHCHKAMLPVSIYTHKKFCQALKPPEELVEHLEEFRKESPLPKRRRAAEKASKFISELNEEDAEEPKDKQSKFSLKWIKNYNFEATIWSTKIFQLQCSDYGSAKCCFDGCEYQTPNWTEIFDHFKICSKKIKGFSCKICLATFKKKSDIYKHLKEVHPSAFKTDEAFEDFDLENEDFSEEEDEENSKRMVNKSIGTGILPKPNFTVKFSSDLSAVTVTKPILFPTAYKWTFEFCKENFSLVDLYPNCRNSAIKTLDLGKYEDYLPKLRYSASMAIKQCQKYVDPLATDYEWKKFNLFESSQSDSGVSTIFCGGPVTALSWVPTPYIETYEQILAVAVQNDIHNEHTVNKIYNDSGLIQFWYCGKFQTAPELKFCITHDHNPVWCLEWCPSGCFDVDKKENKKRLGLLAAGTGDSNVYIYSVYEPSETNGKLVQMKPIKKLSLLHEPKQFVGTLKPHALRISWAKTTEHQYIAVGYATGVVAMFDFKSTSPLLNYKDDDGLDSLMPYKTINAHVHFVTALTLSHLDGGCRWLMSGSFDRTVKFWDLNETVSPISSFSKFVVTDGVWATHWLCSLISFDDSCNTGLACSTLYQAKNFRSEPTNVMHANSSIQCVTSNDWANGFMQGTAAGELQVFLPHQILTGLDNLVKYLKKKTAILGYNRLIEKNVSIEKRLANEKEKLQLLKKKAIEVVDVSQIASNPNKLKPDPCDYKDADDKYGIVFCDYQLNKIEEFEKNFNDYTTSHSDKYYPSMSSRYPMQLITKIQCNPNRGSYNQLAAGYQIGFVRILPMKFISTK